jgi:DMSO/TMAO reductase YedYZ molybdopterin-dependent catalytic subunit
MRAPWPARLSRRSDGPLHDDRVATLLGLALGVSFTACFVTGLISHLIQDPPGWFHWPARPVGLYRLTQGVHVFTGLASIPLLLAKLWSVYPRLWRWPPFAGVAHAVERVSLVPLVAGSLFLLFTGVANIAYWYPWLFFFPAGHHWAAWITMGALITHIGAKTTTTRSALARPVPGAGDPEAASNRRAFLATVAATSGALILTTVGEAFRPLVRLAVLAPRRMDAGPQGLPVNESALQASVADLALDPGYRLAIEGNVVRPLSLSLSDLRALPQREVTLPITCVEGWSVDARWLGVPFADLLELAGAAPEGAIRVESLQPDGLYRVSLLDRAHALDPVTLLALELNGEPLHIDHGYPARLVAPNRPGVMQTKWVGRVVATDA